MKVMNIDIMKTKCDEWLEIYFKDKGTFNKKLYDAMYYSISVGGKRIRPILMLMSYRMYKDDFEGIIPVACAMEMIHTYSLIHDDLPCMDNDDFRRGKPTNHKIFGEEVAVLAGDGLLNEAMNIMFDYCDLDNKSIKACSLIAKSAGADGMIGGQIVDILAEGRSISIDELMYMHSKKTGALITAAVTAGALLGGAPEADIAVLKDFGGKLGLAFQIKDDILDVVGDEKILGKSTHKDENSSKSNFISMYGLDKCIDMCKEITDECSMLLKGLHADSADLEKFTMFLLDRNC